MKRNSDADGMKALIDDQGQVWYCVGRRAPRSSGMSLAEFMRSRPFQTFRGSGRRVVRMSGRPDHAEAIIELSRRQLRGQVDDVQVCTPAVHGWSVARPVEALLATRAYNSLPALGGWQSVASDQLASYELIVGLRRASTEPEVAPLLERHPVWPALSFLSGIDLVAAARMLAYIIDPRYHIRRYRDNEPDFHTGVYDALGLRVLVARESNQQARSVTSVVPADHVALFNLTRSVWDRKTDLRAPGAILQRAKLVGETPALGELEASRWLVRFLCDYWRDRLSVSHKGFLFDDSQYLSGPELYAWREHLRKTAAASG